MSNVTYTSDEVDHARRIVVTAVAEVGLKMIHAAAPDAGGWVEVSRETLAQATGTSYAIADDAMKLLGELGIIAERLLTDGDDGAEPVPPRTPNRTERRGEARRARHR